MTSDRSQEQCGTSRALGDDGIRIESLANRRRKQWNTPPPRRGRREKINSAERPREGSRPSPQSPKGSSAFLPSDAVPCRTPRTKLNSLKTNALDLSSLVKNPTPLVKFPRLPATPSPPHRIHQERSLTPVTTNCYVESLPWAHFTGCASRRYLECCRGCCFSRWL